MTLIVLSVIVLCALAIFFGVVLNYAGKKLFVPEDERVSLVRERLPGAHCGACGLIGCDDFAASIVEGNSPDKCPVASNEQVGEISKIMGIQAREITKKTAVIKCGGTDEVSKFNYKYGGIYNCAAAALLANGGAKACRYGCIGEGSCERICKFGAVTVKDALAVIDAEKCTACGMCVSVCPKNLIEIIPAGAKYRVLCNTPNLGKIVRANCSVGCIGCKMCVKICAESAVTVDSNLAVIDYEKCVNCGDCAQKCPTKAIG